MNVVSFFAPRHEHPFYQDYTPFLDILRASCAKFGHRHLVITDDPKMGPDAFGVALPHNLMKAIIQGQLAYLNSREALEDTVFVGADCVLARDPAEVFKMPFDVAFTTGPFSDCILNTGAIFIRGGADVRHIWAKAFAGMGEEWGDDQKALAAVVSPTIEPSITAGDGPIIRFLPVDPYNLAPEYPDDDCMRGVILHFRGPRKAWMKDYCAKWLGIGERVVWQILPNTSKEAVWRNVEANSRLVLPWVKEMPHHDGHAVIVGGGPSAIDTLVDVRERQKHGQDVFALNGVAQWLAQYGIFPKYQVILDSRPENRRFVRPISAEKFLIASQCDPGVFAALSGQDVTLFHHAEEGITKHFEGTSVLIGGGITVGLTAMALVYALGYRQMHLYGYDSSDRDGSGHAYEQSESGPDSQRRDVWLGRRKYSCAPAMYAQAQAFPEFAELLRRHDVTITVHGSGLLPDIARQTYGSLNATMAA